MAKITERRETRADRIAAAEARVVKFHDQRLGAEYDDAVVALNCAKASYDVGERVHVAHTCRRGCCVEWAYDGVVAAENSRGHSYAVRRDDGGLSEYVSVYDMTRRPSWEHTTEFVADPEAGVPGEPVEGYLDSSGASS